MTKPLEDTSQRILKCAKQEFLEKGFSDASLRSIAAKAGTTTGSIYSRFGGKEELYAAIVEPAADHVVGMFQEIQEQFHHMKEEDQPKLLDSYTTSGMEKMLDYIYEHFEEFQILLDASYGTQDFVEHLVELETEYTYKYLDTIRFQKEGSILTREFTHIMNKALFESYFEVVRHKMPKEKAVPYIRMLEQYHYAGWNSIFRSATKESDT